MRLVVLLLLDLQSLERGGSIQTSYGLSMFESGLKWETVGKGKSFLLFLPFVITSEAAKKKDHLQIIQIHTILM